MSRLVTLAILILTLSCTSLVYADVPVINGYGSDNNSQTGQVVVTDGADSGSTNNDNTNLTNTNAATNTAAAPDNSALPIKQRVTILERQVNNLTQLLAQVNQLQSQIQDLRGQVEVQKHTIKVLQDQVRSQYQDLDQRLSVVQSKPAKAPAKATKTNASNDAGDDSAADNNAAATDDSDNSDNTTDNNNTDSNAKSSDQTTTTAAQNNDQKAYQAAVDLLKNKKYSQATTAFQKFIKQYPKSQQINNGRFWLGQLYLLQGQPDRALEQFHIVLKKDPANKRTPDILLQVGLAYYAKGDMNKAQAAFKRVVQKYPNTSAAKLAQSRLKLIQQANIDQAAGGADSSNTDN